MGFFTKTIDNIVPPVQTTKEIIEEIHETFNTEVERLLAGTKVIGSMDTDKQPLLDKTARLNKFGFGASKDAVEADKESKRLREIRWANEGKRTLNKAILYFQNKYPLYKFITEESVKTICKKYGLIYGDVGNYKGFVPDKNLKQIENFTVEEEDKAFGKRSTDRWGSSKETISYKEHTTMEERERQPRSPYEIGILTHSTGIGSLPFDIAAPRKDFDLTDHEVKDFKISKVTPPDPVVLQPVMYANTKYYLIVTAWGDEASDPLVVNEKMN